MYVVVKQTARKIAEATIPQTPAALKGAKGRSQTTYCGDSTFDPSMNASKSAAANRGNYSGPNLPWRCLRYIIVTVTISRAPVIAGLNELKSPAPCPPTSKAPYSKEKDTSPTHPSFINTEAARLSTCNPRSAWYVKLLTKLSPPSKNAGRKKITTMK